MSLAEPTQTTRAVARKYVRRDNTFAPRSDSITLGPITFEHATLRHSKKILLDLINNPGREVSLIGFINPHVFNLACQHNDVQAFIKQCNLICIDGIGVQIASLVLRGQLVTRIVAEELFNALLMDDGFKSDAVLIGVTSEELALATEAINHVSSSIKIVDGIDGFQEDSDYSQWLADNSQADLILIGAGSPRSEKIALLAQQHCQRAVIWHIGAGTIKTWANTKRRAPAWISRIGMQWAHRMCYEPHTRSRYLSGAVRFVKNLKTPSLDSKDGSSQ